MVVDTLTAALLYDYGRKIGRQASRQEEMKAGREAGETDRKNEARSSSFVPGVFPRVMVILRYALMGKR